MIEMRMIKLNRGTALGIRIELQKAPLLFIKCDKGFAMCGYLNINSVEKLGDAAFMVTEVSTFDDFLNTSVKSASSGAKKFGVKEGMNAKEALNLLF